MLVRIVAPHFVAGLVVGERTSPIVHYMSQWDPIKIWDYCSTKGWGVEFYD